jgi:hypothetical protein
MKFDVTFFFTTATKAPATTAYQRRFLREALHLLKPHSQQDITYEVSDVSVSNLELSARIDILPKWPAAGRITDTEMIRMGINHPSRARASTALLLWITSMYSTDPTLNPLVCAWHDFTGDPTATLPLTLYTYDFRVAPPSLPSPRKFDTTPTPTSPTKYDGTETTGT